jgi:DNA-binding transcriptional ArsR family regulator
MPVTRLRTRKDARDRATLEAVLGLLDGVEGVEDVATLVGRKLGATRGWEFVMVEPRLYADVVEHLTKHSERPHKAVVLFTRLFQLLPPDGNEVQATRAELARLVEIEPQDVSEIMGELEAVGAVYRRKEGRGVRYYVNPLLGTHLAGAARDKAQAQAPAPRLVQPAE